MQWLLTIRTAGYYIARRKLTRHYSTSLRKGTMQETNDVNVIDVQMAPYLPGWAQWVVYALIVSFGYLAVMGATWPVYGLAALATLGTFMFNGAYNTAVKLYNSQKIMHTIKDILNEGTFFDDESLSSSEGEDDAQG